AISRDMFIFIDEPQGIQDWELAVRGLQDEFECHLFITGSSSRLSSKEIATALRGRALTTILYPLSFKEYLSFKDIDVSVDHLDTKTAAIVQSHFNDFLRHGGYPEVVLANNTQEKLKILKDYYDMTFYKDIVDRYAIKNTYLIGWLMRYVASSAAKEISLNKIFNNLKSKGVKIGKNTLYEYFSALQDAFFSLVLRKFDYSFKNEEIGTPKVYLNDTGFFNLFYVEDSGRRLESAVFIHLLAMTGTNPIIRIHYWKSTSGREVDFVISEGQRVKVAIQSCTELTDTATREREVNGLIACLEELNLDEGIIVTENEERVEKIQGKIIKIYPAWKWFLNERLIEI
nr:ATP-binding protein [Candidatus Sigynarchaeota archaeon]